MSDEEFAGHATRPTAAYRAAYFLGRRNEQRRNERYLHFVLGREPTKAERKRYQGLTGTPRPGV